jgi:hypothetical protein
MPQTATWALSSLQASIDKAAPCSACGRCNCSNGGTSRRKELAPPVTLAPFARFNPAWTVSTWLCRV